MTDKRTAPATSARVRMKDEALARRLRGHGYLVVPPDQARDQYTEPDGTGRIAVRIPAEDQPEGEDS